MPRLTIDNCSVAVPAGGTILDAARKLGLDIPTLCFRDGQKPLTACMLCLVKVNGTNRLVPSCATPAEEGMQIESETEQIHQIRKTGLELLLSDHVGDCVAPCQNACPAHMDIPLMMEQVSAGRLDQAIATVKRDIALPAVLGRVCSEPCERGCRRREVDSPAAICFIKRYVADADLASATPYQPPCKPSTGKTVAIVGAGPTGLSAAFHLLQEGHACTLFDDHPQAGGMLRYEIDEDRLPRSVLDAEIAGIERLGACFRLGTRVGEQPSLADLRSDFDAVLIAAGQLGQQDADRLGVPRRNDRVQADTTTHQTSTPGIFAAGRALRPGNMVIRLVADGKAAAVCIDQFLSGVPVTGPSALFNVPAGRLTGDEMEQLAIGAGTYDRVTPSAGLTDQQAQTEALRCLHCDCGGKTDCRLRYFAQLYGAKSTRYRGDRRPLERHLQHGDVIYEPGKCILCGLCVQIATQAAEPLGLTFIGRGFSVRVDVPFNRSISEGLQCTARLCAQACPTGALVLKGGDCGELSCQSCRASANWRTER